MMAEISIQDLKKEYLKNKKEMAESDLLSRANRIFSCNHLHKDYCENFSEK
jgi:hypothetical protein